MDPERHNHKVSRASNSTSACQYFISTVLKWKTGYVPYSTDVIY